MVGGVREQMLQIKFDGAIEEALTQYPNRIQENTDMDTRGLLPIHIPRAKRIIRPQKHHSDAEIQLQHINCSRRSKIYIAYICLAARWIMANIIIRANHW